MWPHTRPFARAPGFRRGRVALSFRVVPRGPVIPLEDDTIKIAMLTGAVLRDVSGGTRGWVEEGNGPGTSTGKRRTEEREDSTPGVPAGGCW